MSTQPITVPDKQADTVPKVHELIRRRWSPRAFEDRPIPDEDLRAVLEAGRWAASSYNEQPWRFIVARKQDGELYKKLLGVLWPFNQEWAKSAPVLILTAAKKTFSHNGEHNYHALHDTGAALANMMLEATSLGLEAHGMAGFDHEKARHELGIPPDYEVGAAVAIGYPGSPATLPDTLRERELEPRKRKPLSAIAFNGQWDNPLEV